MPLVNIQDKFIVRSSAGGGVAAPAPSITNAQTRRFTVSWNAVPNAISYRLDVSTDSGFTSFVTGYNNKTIAGTSELVTGLSPGTTYYVRVRSVAAGSSSNAVSQQTEVVQGSTLTDGLQAFYALSDETDSSGNGNTLTNNGGVTFASGKIGNAAVFDGTNHFDVAITSNVNDEISFSAWYNSNNQTIADWATLFSVHSTNTGLQIEVSAGTGSDQRLSLWRGDTVVITEIDVRDGNWHHIALTLNSSGTLKLFHNGTVVLTENAQHTLDLSTLRIGNDIVLSPGSELVGLVDAVGIWNRALTEGEIAELYNAGAGVEV